MSDLAYLNARLRAMWGDLLGRRALEGLLAQPDLPALRAALRDSPYGPEVDAAGAVAEAAAVEEGLRRHLSRTFAKLLSIGSGKCGEAVRLVLAYWEVQAIRTVLRGRAAGRPADEILSALVPSGLHDEPALREMCRQPDVRGVVELLVTWRDPYGRPLARALRRYRDPRDLYLLETALDRAYFGQAAGRRRSMGRAIPPAGAEDPVALFLSLSADRANLMTALKAVEDRVALPAREEYFVPGGTVYDRDAFHDILAAPSLPEALRRGARSIFAPALGELPPSSGALSPLSVIERRLERVIRRAALGLLRVDPLGYGLLVCYLLRKTDEAADVRMIVRGKAAGLGEAELRPLLALDG